MLFALLIENIQMAISDTISDQMCKAALEQKAEEEKRQEQLKQQQMEQYLVKQRPVWALEDEREKKEIEYKTAVAKIQSQMIRARYACNWSACKELAKQLEQLETEWKSYQSYWRMKRYGY